MRTLLLMGGLCSLGYGQTVAGFGYTLPGNSITAAPGQVMTFSIFGVAGRFATPVFPISGPNGLPTLVSGLTVEFAQGPLTVQMSIRGVQQNACPAAPAACSPATTFTVQIPYELVVESRDAAVLRVRENASLVAEVAINAVTDSVHVINTCDQTGVWLSIAVSVSPGTCAPMVTHAGTPLVSATAPAVSGETLVLWVYGLGALNHPLPTSFSVDWVEQLPVAVQPFNISFFYVDGLRSSWQRMEQQVPRYAGTPGGGLYQVHLVVPPAPANIANCPTGRGNFRIVVSGPTSADVAEVCLKSPVARLGVSEVPFSEASQ
jgi:uncharacterized protein (TIGR03437 family)